MTDSPPNRQSHNAWDALSDYFDTTKAAGEVPGGSADNMLIAWPVIVRFIATHAPTLRGKRVLDYGCGVGSFAQRLYERGAQVTGIDPSPAMIAKERAAFGTGIDFLVGDSGLLRSLPP